ncbi:MAG: DUF4340 domain-containing protein [Gammaproteobacteria bacterium]|nr:DUF4340 domain-containing protein [Gammaproteobacteria bacterium]
MKTKQWGTLAWVTLIVVALGVGLSIWRDHDVSAKPKRAFPQLEAQLNDITKVSVHAANNAVATLERTEKGWVVVEKSRYPADSGTLRKELLQLAQMDLVEAKTKKPENYAQLGVQALDQGGSEATEVKVYGANNAVIAQVVVGKSAAGGGYVRVGTDAQTWLASARPSFASKAEDWLDKEIISIDTQRMHKVVNSTVPGGYVIERPEGVETPILKDVPKGRAVKDSELRRVMGGLANLRFDNVLPAAQAPNVKAVVKSRFEAKDGVMIEVSAFKEGDKIYASFVPSAGVAATPAPAAANTDATKQKDAGNATTAPAQSAVNAQAEAEKIAQKVKGWVYIIPAYQGEVLLLTRDALLEPLVKLKAKK